MEFEDLSTHILERIGFNLDFNQISRLCSLTPILYEKLCLNQEFWQQKFIQDFGSPRDIPLIWSEAYYQKFQNLAQVYAFGMNSFGQLGLGERGDRSNPTPISNLPQISAISAGLQHSLILTSKGEVYAFGRNFNGELGLSNQVDRWEPTLISLNEKISAISAGLQHSLILTSKGEVYAFGSNSNGELGLGTDFPKIRNIPTLIPNLPEISAISAGGGFSLCLTSKGEVYAFGQNRYGKLGLTRRTNQNFPILIPNLPKILAISAGFDYSLFLTFEGEVYATGSNRYGQLGIEKKLDYTRPTRIPNLPKVSAIAAGKIHSLILTSEGQVYVFGYEVKNIVPNLPQISAISAGLHHDLLLTSEGEVYYSNRYKDRIIHRVSAKREDYVHIPDLPKISAVSAGNYHSLLLAQYLSLFSTAEILIRNNWIKDYRIKEPSFDSNVIMEFVDLQDNYYLIEVQYDPKTNKFYPPSK